MPPTIYGLFYNFVTDHLPYDHMLWLVANLRLMNHDQQLKSLIQSIAIAISPTGGKSCMGKSSLVWPDHFFSAMALID